MSATTAGLLAGVALATLVLLSFAGGFLSEPDNLTIILVSLLFFGMLAFASGYSRDRAQRSYWVIFIIWWGMLASEEVFNYRSNLTAVSDTEFASEAYAQVVLWLIAFGGVLVILLRSPHYLRGMFEGDYKWVSWLTVYSLLSCAYAPSPAFSLAWAFKLALTVVIVHICAREMSGLGGIRSFLNTTLWALLLLIVLPTLRSIFEPDPSGEYGTGALEQRFHEAPTAISALAGLLLIVCLTLYSSKRRTYPLLVAAVAFVLMIAAGGKTGIVAGFFCGVLFYAMQRRIKAALAFTAIVAVGIALALLFTPLAEYASNYIQLEQFGSFTGRTDMWTFAFPLILQKPILGHGYYASRFTALMYEGTPFSGSHMHNSLVEILYNNGVIGLGLLLMMLYVTVRNLWRTIRAQVSPELRYVAIGCLAAFVNLFLNGMFNSTFGGRAFAPYMIMIALVAVSTHLLQISQSESASRLAFSAGRGFRDRDVLLSS